MVFNKSQISRMNLDPSLFSVDEDEEENSNKENQEKSRVGICNFMKLKFKIPGPKPLDNEQVYLTADHLYMPKDWKINEFLLTIVKIKRKDLFKHFRFNHQQSIYENITGLTWGELKDISIIKVYNGYTNDVIYKWKKGKEIPQIVGV